MKPTTGLGINPGAMREQVRLESRSTAQDTVGEQILTWSLFALRRAEVVRTPGKELWASMERNGRVPTMWKLRWLDGVLPAMRLICRGKVYNIVSALDPTGRQEELLITSEELVGDSP